MRVIFGTRFCEMQLYARHSQARGALALRGILEVAKTCSQRLFDGHREPPDQLGQFVQMFGIMVLNGSREPD